MSVREGDLMMEIRMRQRFEDAVLLALNERKGPRSQSVQEASGSWKRQGN